MDINISIDGITGKTYDYIRRGSTFKGLLKALELFDTLKEKGEKQVFVMRKVNPFLLSSLLLM